MILFSLLFAKVITVPVKSGVSYTPVGKCKLVGKPKNGFQKLEYLSGACYLAPKGRGLSSSESSSIITVAEEGTFSFSMKEISPSDSYIEMISSYPLKNSEFKINNSDLCPISDLQIVEKTLFFKVPPSCPFIEIPAGFIQIGNLKNQKFLKALPQERSFPQESSLSPQASEEIIERLPSSSLEESVSVELPVKAVRLDKPANAQRDVSSRLPSSIEPEESVFVSGNNILDLSGKTSQSSDVPLAQDTMMHTIRFYSLTSEDEVFIPKDCGEASAKPTENGEFEVRTQFSCTIYLNKTKFFIK
jgi:hypothetical protein